MVYIIEFLSGYVKTYIILPSTIYGIASNRLVDLNIQKPRSQQIPQLVQASLDRKQGGMVGEGKNLWPNVHIDEGSYRLWKILGILGDNLIFQLSGGTLHSPL